MDSFLFQVTNEPGCTLKSLGILTGVKMLQLLERDHRSRVGVFDAHNSCWRLVHVVGQHRVFLRVRHRQVLAIERTYGLDHGAIDKRRATRLPMNNVCIIHLSEAEQHSTRWHIFLVVFLLFYGCDLNYCLGQRNSWRGSSRGNSRD